MLLALLNSQCCMVFQGARSPLFTNDVTSEVAIKKVLIFEPDQKKRLDTEAEIMKAPQRGWLQIQMDFFRSHTGKEKPWKTCCHEMVMTKSRELSEPETLQDLDHPNICKLMETYEKGRCLATEENAPHKAEQVSLCDNEAQE